MLVWWLGSVSARPRLAEKGALCTDDGLGFLFTLSLARTRRHRERSLDAVCRPHDRQRRGAMIRTSDLSATSRSSWRRPLASARYRPGPQREQACSAPAHSSAAGVCAPMQKFLFHLFSTSNAKSPNHAMQPTAGQRTAKFSMTKTPHPAATLAPASGG